MKFFISFINNSDKGRSIEINRELAKNYIDEMRKLANETNINSNIEVIDVMKMPDVLNTRLSEEDESIIAKEVTQYRKSNRELYKHERKRRRKDKRRFN